MLRWSKAGANYPWCSWGKVRGSEIAVREGPEVLLGSLVKQGQQGQPRRFAEVCTIQSTPLRKIIDFQRKLRNRASKGMCARERP